jgi:hypothetical protein
MKTTVDIKELKELKACESGVKIFKDAHGSNTVTLSQALESNGWDDIWWFIGEAYNKFSKEQQNDLVLLGCTWAMDCLHHFENEFPNDLRPRLAIEAKINFINGEITKEELESVRAAVEAAVDVAAHTSAARSAVWSAVRAAAAAHTSAARSTVWAAAAAAEATYAADSLAYAAICVAQKEQLNSLFLKWEK